MSGTVNTTTEVILVDSRIRSGTVTLPLSTEIPSRMLTIKDAYGNANLSSITILTQGSDTFENGGTSFTMTLPYEQVTLYAGLTNKWIVQGGSRSFGFAASTISSFTANIGSLSASTINGLPASNYVSTGSLLSTTFGIVCTISSAVAGGVGAGVTSTISTSWFMTSSVFASTISSLTANISSLTVNSLQIGNGTAWLDAGPIRATALSTLQLNAGSAYTTSNFFGITSSGTALLFYGLQGGFQQTALAELSTGVGTQELLVFKGSSVSDRIRMQTTGSIVFEPGVSARIFSTTLTPTSNATPAMIINTSSNVGIQTANPGATLDVAGTMRGNTVSTIQALTSSVTANAVSSLTLFTSSVQATTISTQFLAAQSTFRIAGPYGSTQAMIMNISSQLGLNVSTPIVQLHVKDLPYSASNIPMALFDKDPTTTNTVQQTYTGSYISYTVPSAVTAITFNMWGAGGGFGGSLGGAGAFITGSFPVTPGETLRIIVGRGGGVSGAAYSPTDAEGGGGNALSNASNQNGQGGGRSAIQKFLNGSWTEIATAGGGGGATTGFGGVNAGNANWIGQSQNSGAPFGSFGGGATQSAGGTGTSPGTFQKGGTGNSIGGAGGGGYYGGGGDIAGGGGSSFVLSTLSNLPFVTNYNGINGNRNTAIATTYAGYISGVGVNGGGNGLVVLQFAGFREGDYMNMARQGTVVFTINAAGGAALGKSVTTTNYLLDVAGSTLTSQLTTGTVSTLNLFASTLTAPLAQVSTISTLALSASTITTRSVQASTLSSFQTFTSSLLTNGITASTISTLDVATSSLEAAVVQASTISSFQTLTSSILTDTVLTSSLSTISLVNTGTICTNSLVVYGPSTFTNLGSTILAGPVFLTGEITGTNNLVTSSMLISTTTSLTIGPMVSTSMLLTSSIRASSIFTDGTQTIRFSGSASGGSYGPNVDTMTLVTSGTPYTNAIASMAFGVSTSAYPLARIYALDTATSGSPLSQLVFQNLPVSPTSFTSNYSYTGGDQTFTVPTGVTSMQVTLWGAGGGGLTNVGGAGAFVQGTLIVSPGQTYRIIVGRGGTTGGSQTVIYGGGGSLGAAGGNAALGGGRAGIQLLLTATISSASGSGSAITFTFNANHGLQTGQPITVSGLSPSGFNGNFAVASMPSGTQITVVSSQTGSSTGTGTVYAEVVNAGGGGGGHGSGIGGAASFSGTAFSGASGGGGGTQTGGGSGSGGGAGSVLQGGTGGGAFGSGGGGGYYGGGGGNSGGGGSSYTSYTGFTLTAGSNSPNSANQAPATTATGYVSGVAVGGNSGVGGNGLILLASIGGTITEAMRIGSNGFLGIGTTTPATNLDVAGTGRFQTMSTLQTNTSSLTLTTMNAAGSTILSGPVFLTGQLTGINNLVTSSMLISTTSALAASGVASTLSTSLFLTSSIRASSIFTDGTQTIRFSGSASGASYGPNVDTMTLVTSGSAYTGAIASMAFGVSTSAYPLARIYAIDAATSGSPLSQLVFQNLPVSPTSFTSNYSYTGSDQTFTVPTGVTSMQVTLWGAGGSGGNNGANGGAGAFVRGTLIVSPGQTYTIITGQGGVAAGTALTYGGGGFGSTGSGGGRSAVALNVTAQITSASGSGSAITFNTNTSHGLQTGQPITISGLSPSGFNGRFAVASTPSGSQFTVVSSQTGSSSGTGTILADVVNVGGGGSAGLNGGTGAAATFSGTAFSAPFNVGNGGTGGSQTAGGSLGGGVLLGGSGGGGGGGGGGYYGGGCGQWNPGAAAGGGGGSSYTTNANFTLTAGSNSPNSQNQAPATSVAGYVSGVAAGATLNGTGGNGLVLLNSVGGTITEAMRIGSNGFLGIGTATPATNLDVAGTGRFLTASTLQTQTSSILTNSIQVGSVSTINSLTFFGLQGGYNQTALAEISTGIGIQELLVFKGSSVSDRIRMQTTGSIVFEPGVAARIFSTNGATTGSNATPAMVINTSSNVGIQTASPQTTLDVAGTARAQILSTLQTNTSSLTLTTLTAAGSTILSGPVFLTGEITGTNNLVTSSMLTSTVANLGQIYISTATGGAATGSSTLSTSMFFTSSIRASSIFTDGTQTIRFSGSASGASYGPNVDTMTLVTSGAPYSNAIASMAFGVSTSAYPLARIYAIDAATSGSPLSQLVFQNLPVSPTSFTSNYTYTGSDQTFTVPTGVTSMQVTLWGAGGGGGNNIGGAGTFVQGTLIVSPGQTYRIIVGQGGHYNSLSAVYGGGGLIPSLGGNAGAGGGRSGIQLLLTATISSASGSGSAITFTFNAAHGLQTGQPINVSGLSPSGFNGNFAVASMPSGTQITVVSSQTGSSTGTGTVYAEVVNAGGGGGGAQPGTGGPAAFSGTGFPGPTVSGNPGGGGGTQTAGGSGANAGSILQGGTAGGNYAGAGGGGYYGGGGGFMNPGINSGGGGGSSYTSYTAFTLTAGSNSPNSANQAPATTATGYVAGVAVGGNAAANGGSGLVLIASIGGTITEAMRIGSNGYLGIGTTTPATNLDVAGTGRFQTLSTLAAFASSIQSGTESTNRLFTSSILATGISTQILNTSSVLASGIQANFVSTLSLSISSINGQVFTGGVGPVISTSQLLTSSLTASTVCSITANISSISTTALVFGDGTGFVDMGDVLGTSVSTILTYTGALYATSNFFGTQSSLTALQFFGLQSNYTNTALAEMSIGTGIQEFLLFKGSSPMDRIRAQTTGAIVFEAGMPQRFFSTTQVGSNSTPTMILTSTSVGIFLSTPQTTLDVGGTARAQILSTLNLNISSINNASYPPAAVLGPIASTSRFLTSSVQASSISSFQAYFSTLTIDTLTVGTGAGWLDLGPVRTTALSTFQTNIDSNYTNTLFLGNQSSINDILFFGLQGNYNNTALAEISTGTGLQEFLIFKGSSASDRIRMQTTGSIVFEPGVSARLFSTTGATTGSNATPAMIINTASNVGIQTAAPAANTALDVAGTGRFQTLSSLSLYAGAIYGGVFFA